MEYRYFKRDISWLSFNYRVLMEAGDDTLPIGERLNFISIYSSNLEEFYKVRVADHKAIATGKVPVDGEETVQEAIDLVAEINNEVNRQLEERVRIFEQSILPALRRKHVEFYQSWHEVQAAAHKEFVRTYFRDDVLPYLAPVPVGRNRVVSFLRNDRLYLAVRVFPLEGGRAEYFVMKLPYSKAPRFVQLPRLGHTSCIMYLEDVIKANLDVIFPGYEVDSAYCIKISRDADIVIDDSPSAPQLIEQVKTKVKRRKTGVICRFVYDRAMPHDSLTFLMDAYHIDRRELVPGDKHLNLEDLRQLPLPDVLRALPGKPQPIRLEMPTTEGSIFGYVARKDLMLFYPYHSFEHFLHFLNEAANDPDTCEIMATQYRVANHSAVINSLIAAARNGKRVTVFVELKARFDEEHNLATAEMMKAAGIRILYSLPGLKVHAKVVLVLRRDQAGHKLPGYAYISTGNLNEKTATLYADCGLFTSKPVIVNDLHRLFHTLEGKRRPPVFHRLLVTRFNLIPELQRLLAREIELARQGQGGRIILKMNALQDPAMIDLLYQASQAGVQIDLIVRGICCLIPGQEYSRNIRVTRLVDTFLEHARVWYFGNGGKAKLFIGSPDWMKRNLYRRIEAVVPVLDPELKRLLTDMLSIQLADRRKAVFVDDSQRNLWKSAHPKQEQIRAQYAFYEYLKKALPAKSRTV